MLFKNIFAATIITASVLPCTAQQPQDEYSMQVASRHANSSKKTFDDWRSFPTRSIATLNGFKKGKKIPLDRYGGRADLEVSPTGFFYARNENGRWYIIDPEGHPYIATGLVNVSANGSERNQQYLRQKYGHIATWADSTQQMIENLGFNSLGAWSQYEVFNATKKTTDRQLSYTIIHNFMSSYGKQKGKVYQQAGHMGYPDNTLFVFDEDFTKFCDSFARELAVYKNDPNLFGYFSDNELPFRKETLDAYLGKKDKTDAGYRAALAWLKERQLSPQDITDDIRNEFLGYVAEKYFSIVSKAIKKYDPNHLYLGSRFHSYEKKVRQVFEAAGRYVDVIAINYYREWTPVAEEMDNWLKWSGKPFIITEWYVKGKDSGMPNFSGAGWEVATQQDRGLFYQNFALELIEHGGCVGFHWFKYQDNDPTNLKTDPSNRDANKGIVNYRYDTYQPLTEKMQELNTQVYQLADFFDQRKMQKN